MIVIPDFLDERMRHVLRNLMTRDGKLSPEGWVVAKLGYPDDTFDIIEGKNLVTNDGDLYYAQKLGFQSDTVTTDFAAGRFVLGTGSYTPVKTSNYSNVTAISGSTKAISSGYPTRNDSDTDNTGKAVDSITWKAEWTTSDFSEAAVTRGCISDAAPAGSDPLLAYWTHTSFAKDSSTTLTIWVNHNFLGA